MIHNKYLTPVLLLCLTACSPHTDPQQVRDWRVEYRVTGGIVGQVQTLVLTADGHCTVVDRRRGIRLDVIVTPQQLQKISVEIVRLGSNTVQDHTAAPTGHRCADCITRQITIQYPQRLIRHQEQIGVAANPSYRLVFALLSTLLNEGLTAAAGNSLNQ